MASVRFKGFSPDLEITAGKNLLDAALENNIPLEHRCGGICACTACRIFIRQGSEYLNSKSFDETEMLGLDGFTDENLRLACQSVVISGNGLIIIEIP